jgi:DNA-binding NtrC family response regulator
MRVLVVDDESRYRVYLSAKLGSLGHEVAVAETGGQAIERALSFLPNVLVSDWMLRNHVHGLHVADALRAMDAGLPTILMTGFPSRDLRSQARESRIVEFLEKPFELSDLVAAVERAAAQRRRARSRAHFGILVTRGELCVYASQRARVMLASTRAGRSPTRLDQIFDAEGLAALAGAREVWSLVAPPAARRVRWWAHWTRRGDDEGVIGILPERRRFLRNDPRLRMLLGLPRPAAVARIPQSKVLVVDAAPPGEARYVEQLERIGCACVKAESAELALRLLDEDAGFGVVIVHRSVPGLDIEAFVADLRRVRPHAEVIGASERLADELEFAAIGVTRFLHVPWRVGDLLHALET